VCRWAENFSLPEQTLVACSSDKFVCCAVVLFAPQLQLKLHSFFADYCSSAQKSKSKYFLAKFVRLNGFPSQEEKAFFPLFSFPSSHRLGSLFILSLILFFSPKHRDGASEQEKRLSVTKHSDIFIK
jgi:hypothetical protein